MSIYEKITRSRQAGKKLFALLIDPDKFNPLAVKAAAAARADIILLGGSRIRKGSFQRCVSAVKSLTGIPLVIFPGSHRQVSSGADALLLLSLISGRNAEYLIGQHVRAAPAIKRSRTEVIPTGYMLINGARVSATQRVTRTRPIPANHIRQAVSTALAGELLGMKLIYLEAGSGARSTVPARLLREVRKSISVPLIAGGGIDSPRKAMQVLQAGADVVVVGNGAEKNISLIAEISELVHRFR
ncbi:MAG: geranylgeranylglyceryl/heptaprenylglyceryl phosphate synthase [Bacteroidota bacterium]